MRKLVFGALSFAAAFGIELAVSKIPFLGAGWTEAFHDYVFVLTLLVPAAVIALLAYVMGLWRGSDAAKAYALVLCVIVPPIADFLFFLFSLLVLHARML